jgi:hypothetical protein
MTNRDHETDLTRDYNAMAAGDGAAACRWLLDSGLNAAQARAAQVAADEIQRTRAVCDVAGQWSRAKTWEDQQAHLARLQRAVKLNIKSNDQGARQETTTGEKP